MWRSLVARLLREQEAAGSNPVIPTRSIFKHFGHLGQVLFLLVLAGKSKKPGYLWHNLTVKIV
jgi:hypothetical protein